MTEAQINANRENAKKSTGPRTAEGKTASSRNGLKHGLCADKHILLDEDREEFLLLLKDLYDRFCPVGLGEEKLVQRIAAAQWRLDRTIRMEAGVYREQCHQVATTDRSQQERYEWELNSPTAKAHPPAPHEEGDLLARAFMVDCARPDSLAKLARYETSIEHSIDRCLRQLKAFQAARKTSDAISEGPQKPSKPAPASPQVPSEPANYEANPKDGATAAPMHNPEPSRTAQSPAAAPSHTEPTTQSFPFSASTGQISPVCVPGPGPRRV
jgi:hypothetical protein